MPKKRRHHYVPKGLSKGFCSEATPNALFLYDVVEGKITTTSPRDAFVRKDLHKVELHSGELDYNTIENIFSEVEGNGVAAIRSYVKNGSLDYQARLNLALFLGLQVARTPVFRAGAGQMLKEQARAALRILDDAGELPPLPPALKELGPSVGDLLDKNELKIDIVLPQVTMTALHAWPTISDLVFNMNWCLIYAEGNNYFALSDNPCSIFDEHYGRHGMGIGVAHPGVEVALPLDRHHCLLAAWKPIPERKKASEKHVGEINRRTALFGERFYAFPVHSKRMMELLTTYSGGQPETESVTFPASGEDDNNAYLTLSSIIFSSKRHNRLYLGLRAVFQGYTKHYADYRHLPEEYGQPSAGWFQRKPARRVREEGKG